MMAEQQKHSMYGKVPRRRPKKPIATELGAMGRC